MGDIRDRTDTEIRELHQFFEDWFAGLQADTDEAFARVCSALSPDFVLVSPRGVVEGRDSIVASIRAAHGKRPDMQLWTEEHVCRWASEDACLMRYHEHQTLGDVTTIRYSTVMFVGDATAPNGVSWLHVHETWLEPPANQ